jgi:hypothetical protein
MMRFMLILPQFNILTLFRIWRVDCLYKRRVLTRPMLLFLYRSFSMSDTKDKIKEGIDDAASKAKQATEKVVDKTKDAAHDAGEKVKEAGQYIKDKSN